MLNHYPWWKNLLIAFVILIAGLYALPNLYPEDPAVQISFEGGAIEDSVREQIAKTLVEQDIAVKGVEYRDDTLLIRFYNTEAQLEAADAVKAALDTSYTVALNLAPATPGWLRAISAEPMNLGLDLRGGVYFLLEVDVETAARQAKNRYEEEFRRVLREADIRYLGVEIAPSGIVTRFRDEASQKRALDVLGEQYRELELEATRADDAPALIASLSETETQRIQDFALEQNITTLRNRVNELGVAEPTIQQQGQDRIVVQLPGVQDTARAKEILGATATLEFRLVDDQADPFVAQSTGDVPAGSRLYSDREGNPILLQQRVILTGERITDAASGIDPDTGGAQVNIRLDGAGGRVFSDVTGDNVGQRLAVVFIENETETVERNGETVRLSRTVEEVISAPVIQEQLGAVFRITGLDSSREARNLALLLRAGALAAPMQIVEERTVGPSLGQQNIEQGFKSVVIGFILTVIFMAVYYRVFGLIADLALLANLVLLVAIMSIIPGLTLTLPGIAGIVLTVGMAVDANVLINERIREELKNGNSPQASIQAGYHRAFTTILDSNVTTLIAAGVLFVFGTGPVKGFALTLTIGLACSMFTAIMGTRALVNLIYGGRRKPQLTI